MNIKIYVKTINIKKNLKTVYFITTFKKICSTVAKFFFIFQNYYE